MEKIIEELICIERQAAARWDKLLKEKAALAQRIQEESARRAAQIESATDKDIQTIAQTISHEADEKIKRIHTEHRQAVARLEALFEKRRDSWHAHILSCILKA